MNLTILQISDFTAMVALALNVTPGPSEWKQVKPLDPNLNDFAMNRGYDEITNGRIRFVLNHSNHTNKFHISANCGNGKRPLDDHELNQFWFSNSDRDTIVTGIGVSDTKTPAQVARDILRRLMPGAIVKATWCYEHSNSTQSRETNLATNIAALRTVKFPSTLRSAEYQNDKNTDSHWKGSFDFRGSSYHNEVQINHDGRCYLQLDNLTVDEVANIMKVVIR